METKNDNKIQELYSLNRQEITSIFSNSIILFVIAAASGVFSYIFLKEETSTAIDYVILSLIVLISGIVLSFLFARIINLGWINFKIEKELEVEDFGSEHTYFRNYSSLNNIEKLVYKLINPKSFLYRNQKYYHINFKYIIVIIFLSCLASSYFFYKYLFIAEFFDLKEYWLMIITAMIFIILLIVCLYFLRREFK